MPHYFLLYFTTTQFWVDGRNHEPTHFGIHFSTSFSRTPSAYVLTFSSSVSQSSAAICKGGKAWNISDFRLSPRNKWELHYSVLFRSEQWVFLSDVTGNIVSILKILSITFRNNWCVVTQKNAVPFLLMCTNDWEQSEGRRFQERIVANVPFLVELTEPK
jgi:hypothetical protein